jgi:hypothetical protein
MTQSFSVFDFALSDDEMDAIEARDTKATAFFNHRDPEWVQRLGTRKLDIHAAVSRCSQPLAFIVVRFLAGIGAVWTKGALQDESVSARKISSGGWNAFRQLAMSMSFVVCQPPMWGSVKSRPTRM